MDKASFLIYDYSYSNNLVNKNQKTLKHDVIKLILLFDAYNENDYITSIYSLNALIIESMSFIYNRYPSN